MAPTSRSSAWHHVRRCRKTGAKARMRAARRAGRRGTAASLGGDGPALPSHPPHHLQVRAGRRTRPQTAKVELRICGESSRFGVPIARLGLVMAPPELQGLIDLVGRATALEIRVFAAEEALRKGLVTRVVPDDQAEAEAYAAARRIADGAPLVALWHK